MIMLLLFGGFIWLLLCAVPVIIISKILGKKRGKEYSTNTVTLWTILLMIVSVPLACMIF